MIHYGFYEELIVCMVLGKCKTHFYESFVSIKICGNY